MKIAKRYLLLQRIVWVQSLLTALLAIYVLVARKRAYPLNVTVNEVSPVDSSILDAVTNITRFAHTASATPSAPVTGGVVAGAVPQPEKVRYPFRFDHYCVVSGVACAAVGNRVFREGDFLNGCKIESISPLGVIVDGFFYHYSPTIPEVKEI